MRWPWVSRGTMEAWQAHAERADARFDALWQRYVEVTAPKAPKPPVMMPGHSASDEQVVKQAEDGFVRRLAEDFQRQGIPTGDAIREANRIRRSMTEEVV